MATTGEYQPLIRSPVEGTPGEPFGLSWRRAVVIPSMVLYFFGLGIYSYVPPEYVQNHFMEKEKDATSMVGDRYNICTMNKSDPSYEAYTRAQQEAAMWINYFSVACSGPAILTTLVWTSYSDIIGRKFLFILCASGLLLKLVIITLVVYFKASLVYIVIANVIDGLTGSVMTIFAVLFSFVADITNTRASRTIFIVMLELLIGVTITISTFATGYFIKDCGYFYPMLTSVVLTLCTLVMIASLLPETMANKRQGSVNFFFTYVHSVITIYTKPGPNAKRAKYLLLITSFFLLAIPSLNRGSLETLYQLGRPFCWSPTKIGLFGTIKIGLASILGLLGVVVMRKCLQDDSIAAISAFMAIVSFIVEGLASTDTVLYIVPVIAALAMVPFPMIRSLMSHMTPPDKQGALFAGIGAVETICNLVGGLTNNLVYSATMTVMNGFVFLLMALITAFGLIVMLVYMCVRMKYKDEVNPTFFPDQEQIVT